MLAIHRKIRCPRHFLLKTGVDKRTGMLFKPFKMQINPGLKLVPKWAFEKWPSLIRHIPVRDKYGRKIRDDRSFYQPLISASFALHQVYDPKNAICKIECKGRCLEGLGTQIHTNNKRIERTSW